ncbi:hypothetical protein [Hymenobacter sp. B81]|uniref:hypothetical protein n=1 Tax=Hymenobacter sp. B81 TaxID=3344878 RepID=UPI0037DCC0A9
MKNFITTTPDGAECFNLQVPTSWADVTLAQYLRLLTEPDAHPLCILTILTPAQLDRLHYTHVAILAHRLEFLADTAALSERASAPDLPDVGDSTYGQMVLATQYLEQHADQPLLACAPYLYALYRHQQLLGRYDEVRLAEMEAAVLAAPVPDVYADLVFILAAWQRSTSATLPTSRMTWTSTPTTNSTPVWKTWLRSLACLRPWTRSAAATRPNTRPSST